MGSPENTGALPGGKSGWVWTKHRALWNDFEKGMKNLSLSFFGAFPRKWDEKLAHMPNFICYCFCMAYKLRMGFVYLVCGGKILTSNNILQQMEII